jgi:hypothetical protein
MVTMTTVPCRTIAGTNGYEFDRGFFAIRWLEGCDKLKAALAAGVAAERSMSGRSAAWLARLVRDQEVEGSNPFAPTTFPF